MKRLLIALVLLAIPAWASAGKKWEQGKLKIWVDAATDSDGWSIDPLEDSATDIRKKITGGFWEKAESIEVADVRITVTNRYNKGTGIRVAEYTHYGDSASLQVGESNVRVVEIQVTVLGNDKTKEFYGWHGGMWSAAGNYAKGAAEKFLKQNYGKIVILREDDK